MNVSREPTARILLVDDDRSLLKLLTMRLEAAGYIIYVATNAKEALSKIQALNPDLMITDLCMDEMSGIKLYREVRKTSTFMPVIMITAHGSIPEAVSATKEGIYSFIQKPIAKEILLEDIRGALEVSGFYNRHPDQLENAWNSEIITRSPLMNDVLNKARLVCESDVGVMLVGDNGTGKELLAKAIHNGSRRMAGPFISVYCGSIAETALEAELFGYENGVFLGAVTSSPGALREADGGTVYLSEVDQMSAALQLKLLRYIEDGEIKALGGMGAEKADTRIISAVNSDMEQAVFDNKFRDDLFYKLNVVTLKLPTLSERREDIALLASHFLDTIAKRYNSFVRAFAPQSMELLINADWPGNVTQLYNIVEQIIALATNPIIPPDLVMSAIKNRGDQMPSFAEARNDFERDFLIRILRLSEGNVTKAAQQAKRNRTDFYKLLSRHKIEPALFKAGGSLT